MQNISSYKSQVQALTLLMCGLQIVNLYNTQNDELTGPRQSFSIHTSVTGNDTFVNQHNINSSSSVKYKSDDTYSSDSEFALAVSKFYENLSNQQVSLGHEIENVISTSLWDMYLE